MWYENISKSELQALAFKGKIRNRIISWRIMLNIITGTSKEKIEQTWNMRKQYKSLKDELEPQKSEEGLDPSVFNPLSQHNTVAFN